MARKKDLDSKRNKKLEQFLSRTSEVTGCSKDEIEKIFSNDLGRFFRVNSLKSSTEDVLNELSSLGWVGREISWCENGYSIEKGFEQIRDSDLNSEGVIYLQNPSSWIPVLALNMQDNVKILDVCSAPGGKISHAAAIVDNNAEIFVNDNSKNRLHKLQKNMGRLGVEVQQYSLFDATKLTRKFIENQFDYIILDAPCSGEGLINVNTLKDFDGWSVAHIKRLGFLQKGIISEAFKLLKPGGKMVYSTCTLAPEENEMVVEWLVRKNNNAKIITLPQELLDVTTNSISSWNGVDFKYSKNSRRVIPKDGMEAFFIALIQKDEAWMRDFNE